MKAAAKIRIADPIDQPAAANRGSVWRYVESAACTALRYNFFTGYRRLRVYLIDHPDAGNVIPGAGGVRQAEVCCQRQGKTWWRTNRLRVRCSRCPDL